MSHKDILTKNLESADPAIFSAIEKEQKRQCEGLELIASENYVSKSVMQAQGSVLTNKYAEGYPQKRYYGGCEFVDQSETLAIERAKELFDVQYTNVQPHSGSQANMATYLALAKPGAKVMGMDLSHGGHLTHGSPVNFSGLLYDITSYGLDPETGRLNYEQIRQSALKNKPEIIIAGYSAYPRVLDFVKFREIADEVGSYLMVDMAHFAGLVAGRSHPSPIPYADVVTTTTHKTLRGPRGGMILTNSEELNKKLNSKIFPGIQGGPLEHVIAAKAVSFSEALQPEFANYAQTVIENAQTLGEELMSQGLSLVTGGTDNHLLLMDFPSSSEKFKNLTGKIAEKTLDDAGITVNKNTIPNEQRSPFVTSGIRIGTAALTTRGMGKQEMKHVATWIGRVLSNSEDTSEQEKVRNEVMDFCQDYPLY